MLRKRLGLSTEPQPVFVGSCFALLALLMQVYLIIITRSGKLIALFNNPLTLAQVMTNDMQNGFFAPASWLIMLATPIFMFIFALLFGKKRAVLLCIPSCLPMAVLIMVFIFTSFLSYHLIYVAYFIVGLLYIFLAMDITKSAKPVCITTVVFMLLGIILTLVKMPPFYLKSGEFFLSELFYFISYNFAVFNFARAIPMQREAKKKNK